MRSAVGNVILQADGEKVWYLLIIVYKIQMSFRFYFVSKFIIAAKKKKIDSGSANSISDGNIIHIDRIQMIPSKQNDGCQFCHDCLVDE